MYLMYADESGSTGTDYDNKQQPIFCLAGICVEDCKWHDINNKFEEEKVKIYPEFKDNEIHAMELFNAPRRSIFNKYSWQENLNALEKIVDLIVSLDIIIHFTSIDKLGFKKYLSKRFGNSILIDPYLYAFGNIYYSFNEDLLELNSYGLIFTDELNSVTESLDMLYPKLKEENTRIIEKSLYLDSKKNNFIQIADVCALYLNKYRCLSQGYHKYNEIKTKHCIEMYQKLIQKAIISHPHHVIRHTNEDIVQLFEQKNVQEPLE